MGESVSVRNIMKKSCVLRYLVTFLWYFCHKNKEQLLNIVCVCVCVCMGGGGGGLATLLENI